MVQEAKQVPSLKKSKKARRGRRRKVLSRSLQYSCMRLGHAVFSRLLLELERSFEQAWRVRYDKKRHPSAVV